MPAGRQRRPVVSLGLIGLLFLVFGLLPPTLVSSYASVTTAPAKLVGNANGLDGWDDWDDDNAQSFTTGSEARGYTLTSVDLYIRGPSSVPGYSVSIHSNSSGAPGDVSEPHGVRTETYAGLSNG